jgi:hypothetical protein
MKDKYDELRQSIDLLRKSNNQLTDVVSTKIEHIDDAVEKATYQLSNLVKSEERNMSNFRKSLLSSVANISSVSRSTKFRVNGDPNHFYPVLINPVDDSGQKLLNGEVTNNIPRTYFITRKHDQWASNAWNRSSKHRAMLSFQFEASDKNKEAGRNHFKVIDHRYRYQRTVATVQTIGLGSGAIVIFLRGQGEYNITSNVSYKVKNGVKGISTAKSSNPYNAHDTLYIFDSGYKMRDKIRVYHHKPSRGRARSGFIKRGYYTYNEVYNRRWKPFTFIQTRRGVLRQVRAYTGSYYKISL